jgi:tungstate transport system ATP-binding protein
MREAAVIPFVSGKKDRGLELVDICYSARGYLLLDRLSIQFPPAGITAILGPNGAGKSLTLRVTAGLVKPDSGAIHYPYGLRVPRDTAMVFQEPVLLRRSARANLRHALAIYRSPRRGREAEIDRLLGLAMLGDLADRPARVLSGGERQRLALVRALAGRPKLLFLDEPTANLDPNNTAIIENLVREIADAETKIVLVTHDLAQARRVADEIRFLHKGRLIEAAPASRFFTHPATPEAIAYLSGELLI